MGRVEGKDIGQVISEMDLQNVANLMKMANNDIGCSKIR
jgi:hypothetical protein